MKKIIFLAFIFCTACTSAISTNLYSELKPINDIFDAGDYTSAKKQIDRIEKKIGSDYTTPIDKKMIYSFKGAVFTGLNDYESAIIYYRKASNIKTDNKNLEINDLTALIKLCVAVRNNNCANKAYNELPQAISLFKKDRQAKLILDFRFHELKNSGIPVQITFDIDKNGVPENISSADANTNKNAINEAKKIAAKLRYIPTISSGKHIKTKDIKETIYINPKWLKN